MPRRKNEDISVLEKPTKTKKTKSIKVTSEPKYFVDGHGDVREYYEVPKQYEIDWNKIAADVREAAQLVEQIKYESDDGALTKKQLNQIKKTALKPSKKK